MTAKREKFFEDVREHQEGLVNSPAEFHAEAATLDDGKMVEVHATAGRVFVNTHGEAEFDADSLMTLIQKLQAAFQNAA